MPAEPVLKAIDDSADEMVEFAAELIRVPTVNPPGEEYRRCADLIGRRMTALGFQVERFVPTDRPEHTADHPRVNVIGTLSDGVRRPCVHFNGHFDVVPPGVGWTVDPYGGLIRDGRLHGRGSADMKSGLAAAIYAAAALHRVGATASGTVEVSATVDEESGGFAGVAHLAQIGRIAADRTDYVIIPEPFGPNRISLGHRGVYWFKITAHGQTGHGGMPHLGRSAIDDLSVLLGMLRDELAPRLRERRTAMPVVPDEARCGSINVNSLVGGQVGSGTAEAGDPGASRTWVAQTPCVADHAEAVIDRRFLAEEALSEVRGEIVALLDRAMREDPGRRYELCDLMVVQPVLTPADSPLVRALERAVSHVVGRPAELVASPGTYDQKHVVRIGGVEHCVAYGPGELEQAHQPNESCAVDDIVTSARVMALSAAELLTQ